MSPTETFKESKTKQLLQESGYRDKINSALQVIYNENPLLILDEAKTTIPFLDAVYQLDKDDYYQPQLTYDYLEMHIAAEIWQMMEEGRLSFVAIRLNSETPTEQEYKVKQKALKDIAWAIKRLDGLFSGAEFVGDGHNYCRVGTCGIDSIALGANGLELRMQSKADQTSTAEAPAVYHWAVGYTQPSVILSHLESFGACARWPFGSPYILLFSLQQEG
jgi:hypothetical protein